MVHIICARSSMDRVWVCGTQDRGPIPRGRTERWEGEDRALPCGGKERVKRLAIVLRDCFILEQVLQAFYKSNPRDRFLMGTYKCGGEIPRGRAR
ncbi:MAG: hypothetical protein G01um101429_984 [Parcubacteria group bacterium Gr01-1014_29]|nr:MAG: hypothetical protein G01um101429_984 [Parcubacteria group bacterium Gr01-1014_29]